MPVHPCLEAAGIDVVDVDRPARFDRRRAEKSDRLDAFHAARAVLAGRSYPVKGPAIEGSERCTWHADQQ